MILLLVSPFLLALLPGLSYELQLEESGPGTVRPGDTLELTCTVTGASVISIYYWHWIRQTPGKGLEWMGYWSGSTRYFPSFQNRITISVDPSKAKYFLRLTSVTTADTATYYCVRPSGSSWYDFYAFEFWGQGTMVTVTSATPTAPTVFPLPPCCQDRSTSSQVTLGCLVTGYFPDTLSVTWKEGARAISTGIQTFPATTLSSSGHYTLSSQLTIPTSSWQSGKFQCDVDHTPTRSTISKQIEPCKTKAPVPPVVSLFHSSPTSRSSDAMVELVCRITGFYPSDVEVDWMVGEQTGLLSSFTEPPRRDENGHTFSTISTVNISQSSWQDGGIFVCQVTHKATRTRERRTAKICEGSSPSEVRLFMLRPDPNDIFVEKRPKLTCMVINLESDIGLVFNWQREKRAELITEELQTKDELNGTITASSVLFISEQDWMSGETFTCTVKHPALPLPKSTSISKKKEKATAPSVYLFRPHHEELISNGEYVSITALVKGFNPNEIALKWLHGNEPLAEDDFINTPVLRDRDNTYVMFSKLKVLKSVWNRGDSFSCMVVHEGLRMKFIQKNIEKHQGKK